MDPAWSGLAWRELADQWWERQQERRQEAIDAEELALWEERQRGQHQHAGSVEDAEILCELFGGG